MRKLHGRVAEIRGSIMSTTVYGADEWLGVITRTDMGDFHGYLLQPDDDSVPSWQRVPEIDVAKSESIVDVQRVLHSRFESYLQDCLSSEHSVRGLFPAQVFPAAQRPERGMVLQPHPQFGKSNPESVDNTCWSWAVGQGINGYELGHELQLDRVGGKPFWSFDRFGMSRTMLEDGRIICVAGEHEDSYDPDFNIYNDVVVMRPGQAPRIYTYPESDFAPTDFHSATLVGGELILIGGLGYKDRRDVACTPIYRLDIETFVIARCDADGDVPGWIYGHAAEFDQRGRCIRITVGTTESVDGKHAPKSTPFRLDLDAWRWRRC